MSDLNLAPLIYVLVFTGILLAVEGIYLIAFGRGLGQQKRINRRLEMLREGADHEEVLSTLRKEQERHRATVPLLEILTRKATQADIALTPTALLMVMLMLSGVAFALLTIATDSSLLVRFMLALLMGSGGLYMWIARRAKKRMAAIEEQLPDGIDLIVRSLRVGHPVSAAIQIVAQELPAPLGAEFAMIADEAAYGMDLTESLDALAARIDTQDLRFLAVAVNIQANSGGNLAEILEGLSRVIRARFRLARKVRTLTAEARWSGWFLSAFPLVALAAINLMQPTYYDAVRQSVIFLPAAIGVALFLVVNVLFMRIMVNIKV